MNPTDKQKCIAEQAIYGDLMTQIENEVLLFDSLGASGLTHFQYLLFLHSKKIDDIYPILRPISDLTKETTHREYNNNQPFIPLYEVVKNNFHYPIEHISCEEDAILIVCNGKERSTHRVNLFEVVKKATKETYDILHMLHFDTRNLIEQGEAIDVNTLDINYYTV